MTEWAKFASDGGRENGGSGCGAPKPKLPLWRRVRLWGLLLVICAIPLGLAVGGGFWMRRGLRPGTPWEDTLYYLLIGAMLFVPLGLMVWTLVRTRITTGRWAKTAEARAEARAQRAAARGTAGVCATSGCAAKKTAWGKFAVAWASCTAMDRERSAWERAAAWAVLAGYVLAMLGMTAIGVISFGAAFADGNTAVQTCLFIGLGLAVLVVPGLAVRRLILAIRAGRVGATREEVEQMRAERAAWRVREWQKPLRTKIATTAFVVVLYGVLMLHGMHRAQHSHDGWVTAAIYAPILIYGIWVQFRRPKGRPLQGSDASSSSQT